MGILIKKLNSKKGGPRPPEKCTSRYTGRSGLTHRSYVCMYYHINVSNVNLAQIMGGEHSGFDSFIDGQVEFKRWKYGGY